MIEKIAHVSQYMRILRHFPDSKNMKFCFAYGSGAFKQKVDTAKNMLDLVFVVQDPNQWHKENMICNPSHYAQPLRFLGHKIVANVQESWGARIYYNTLVKMAEGRIIKYGIVSELALVEDLLDWNVLYLAGRLHKPVHVLVPPDENSHIPMALVQNLHSAIHTALLLLPEHFTEIDFYKVITGLSYNGDFRMIFGEDKDKVSNIVIPQLQSFRHLYAPILKHFDNYVEIPDSEGVAIVCHQDTSPGARIHHLNHLPRTPQVKLVRPWSPNLRSQDTEDCLRAIAYDPECSEILDECLRDIVWRSSVSQSLKGIVTAGFVKSIKYSGAKIMKMLMSDEQKKIPASDIESSKIEKAVESVAEKQTNTKSDHKRIQ